MYLSAFGWSDLAGTLDATIEHRFETGGAHEVSGTLSLSDVAVSVPSLERPALAWKRLGIGIEKLDLVKQHAAVSSVALEGARIVVDPKADVPVPLLTPPPTAPAAAAPAAAPAPPAAASAQSPKPWTWRVAKLAIADSNVDLLGAAQPLPIGDRASRSATWRAKRAAAGR